MKYYNKIAAIFLMAALLTLSGCAENQIPDLTDEEMQEIGELVAITLMKYDAGHTSRLMDLSEAGAEYRDDVAQQPSESPDPEESTGMPPVDDTPVVDASGALVTTENIYTMEEVMGLPEGVTAAFLGHEFHSVYPEDSDFFSVTAPDGKKIMALRFSLTNTSEQEQSLDLLSSGATYRITVNGNYTRNALTTGLLDDLSTYKEALPAGGSAEAVLLIQVDGDMEEEISSIGLIIKNGSKSYKTVL